MRVNVDIVLDLAHDATVALDRRGAKLGEFGTLKAIEGDVREAQRRYGEPTEPPDEKPEILHEWVAKFEGQKFVLLSGNKPNDDDPWRI